MKILSALTIASLLLAPIVHADNHRDHKMPMANNERILDCTKDRPFMHADLGLSAEQKQKVQAIHEEAQKKHQALRQETHAKVLSVLTPEQGKKLEALHSKKMERRADKMEKKAEQMEKRSEKIKDRAEKMQPPTTAPTSAQ